MVATSKLEISEVSDKLKAEYNRASEVKAFDESKAGVKGLVDDGITEIPRIFHHTSDEYFNGSSVSKDETQLSIPIVDLGRLFEDDPVGRKENVVEEVREASETRGFFQLVNHGIPFECHEVDERSASLS
nr:1-aminocyclopropane-1-carboxylate oxidase homolog 2-like [Ziziphus jujuba var. spinosa]